MASLANDSSPIPSSPWIVLPADAPFVLPEDRLAVDIFNRTADSSHRLRVETPPEPFLGRVEAPIVVLLLNPGISADGIYDARLLDELREAKPQSRHFYIGAANRWWDTLVRSLARDRPDADMASVLMSVEFFPYRSDSFGCGHVRLPSQAYSFTLVESAMERGAAIVIARGERHWMGAVPALADYEDLVRIKNPRRASLSPANLEGDGYRRLLDALDDRNGGQ